MPCHHEGEYTNGRTVVMITHRFTIAMHADMIHVMDAGRIVESSSHHEWVAQGGAYAQSWAAQMHAHLSPLPSSEGGD